MITGHGGRVAFGGTVDVEARYVAPTLIVDPRPDSPIMTSEVFGPVLTFIGVDSLDAAIAYAAAKPTPLALYFFGNDAAAERRVLDSVPSGNACINDVVVHFANPYTPFGGLGASGMGSMHGESYFKCCTQDRGIMSKGTGPITRALDLQCYLRAAPYATWKTDIIRFALHPSIPGLPPRYVLRATAAAVLAAAAMALRANSDAVLALARAHC